MADIVMPQLGETVTEGTITKWFKKIGDPVAQDEVLFEVSTDKVDSEVPSTATGVLAEIRVPEGETVDVGTILAVLADAGAPVAAAPSAAAPPAPSAAAPPPPPVEAPAPATVVEAAPAVAPPAPPPPPPPPAVPAAAAAAPAAPSAEPAAPTAPTPVPAAASGESDGRLLSPIVRRLVAENSVDVSKVQGTGPGGRITRTDVELAIEAKAAGTAAPATPLPAPAAPPAPPAAASAAAPAPAPSPAAPVRIATGRGDTRQPLNRIRKITGDHMVMSKATSAHTLTVMEVDFSGVDRVRSALRDEWKTVEGFSLTYLPFICRAVVDAIADFPGINASVDGSELVIHGEINLGIAVDLNFEGLVAPVIKQADGKRLRAISREIVDLANRARTKKLGPDDISGGTFSITNPGQYGTLMQFPIINQPQVAILSTDGVKRKPWVVTAADGTEAIAIRPIGLLALAWDHRAFDGAYAAAFLAKLRDIIETRDWLAEVQ